jgi:hypothetical protein
VVEMSGNHIVDLMDVLGFEIFGRETLHRIGIQSFL